MSHAILSERAMRIEFRSLQVKLRAVFGFLFPDPKKVRHLIWMSTDDLQAEIEAQPQLAQAKEFSKTIEPKDNVDYDWIWNYAKDKFDRAEQTYNELDDKANDIIKYLGGGTGLFALATLANITPKNFYVFFLAVPSFVLAVVSIALAASARRPNPVLELPDIRRAYRFVTNFENGESSKAAFLGQWDLACEGMFQANLLKAERIELATTYYLRAITFLAVPIIVAIAANLILFIVALFPN
jgi:hypothetical protein